MSRYAKDTSVPVSKSRAEIEAAVERYGATQFASGWRDGQAAISFVIKERAVRFILPLPDKNAEEFTHWRPGNGYRIEPRTPDKALEKWEQACRQRWRALALVIKAKLEAVETGITTLEDEFMAHIVMPNGQTLGEWAKPQIALAYQSGKMPPLLPGPGQ